MRGVFTSIVVLFDPFALFYRQPSSPADDVVEPSLLLTFPDDNSDGSVSAKDAKKAAATTMTSATATKVLQVR